MSDKVGAPARMRVVANGEPRGAAPAEAASEAKATAAELAVTGTPAAESSLWLPAGLFILGSVAGGAGATWWLL